MLQTSKNFVILKGFQLKNKLSKWIIQLRSIDEICATMTLTLKTDI